MIGLFPTGRVSRGDTGALRLWHATQRHAPQLCPERHRSSYSASHERLKEYPEWHACRVYVAQRRAAAGDTPADATYCIGRTERYSVSGACFFVGTYRAQDLWAEAKIANRILRDGERFELDVSGGYYSGGPAAGIEIAELASYLDGFPLHEAYPDYADYQFIEVTGEDVENASLDDTDDIEQVLDVDGQASMQLRAVFDSAVSKLPAFGRLYLNAEIKPTDREATVSNEVEARYTRFERFVGLRIEPRWLDASTPVRIQGVVIDADGKLIPDAQIQVAIDYLPGFGEVTDKNPAQRLAECALQVGSETACDFPRHQSGRYRLTARSGSAAPTRVTRLWGGSCGMRSTLKNRTRVARGAERDGSPVRVLLKQPHSAARVCSCSAQADDPEPSCRRSW